MSDKIAELAARIDAAEARLRELATQLVDASVECANELRRLGHGMDVLDVITESGARFTSIVGDPAWDTADNRARVRAHHARVEQELAAANAALKYIREAHETWRHVENTPDINLMLDAAIGQAFSRLRQSATPSQHRPECQWAWDGSPCLCLTQPATLDIEGEWVHAGRHPKNCWSSLCPECQPAAPIPTDAKPRQCDNCGNPYVLTEADQAVLDAMKALTERYQREERWPQWWPEWVAELERAKLARGVT